MAENNGLFPPPLTPGLDLRTWLAGCAMANSNIVTSTDVVEATGQAIAAADALMSGLKNPMPTKVAPPSPKQLQQWERELQQSAAASVGTPRTRDTVPDRRAPVAHFTEATRELRKASEANLQAVVPRSPGRYSVVSRDDE